MIKATWTGATISVWLEAANARKDLPAGYALIRNADGKDLSRTRYAEAADAIAAAEAVEAQIAERKAAKAETAPAPVAEAPAATTQAATNAPLATPTQVAYIQKLIRQGRRTEGGFFNGPTNLAGIRALTKTQASAYIDSLTGQY